MASYESYITQGKQSLNTGYDYTIQQLIAALGGLNNPAVDQYIPAEYRNITDPQLRSISEYLQQLGAEGYQYQYSDILNTLNNATNAAYDARYNTLDDANAQFNRNMAAQQDSVADTIRGQYAQAIQSGVSRGMQSANILSSILGTTQAAAQNAQQLAEDRYQTGIDKQAQLLKDASDALTRSNSAYETLMSNIRQLYNDEIQEKTADLEYNASIADTNAQHASSIYTADTNYAQGVLSNASGIYNGNQSALAQLIAAAAGAAAQDGYSDNYLKAALEAANATKYAADQSASASKYSADRVYDLNAAQEAARKAAEAQAAAEQKAKEAQDALNKSLAESSTKNNTTPPLNNSGVHTYIPPTTADGLTNWVNRITGVPGTSPGMVSAGITQIPGATDYYTNLVNNTVSVPKGQGYGLNTSAGANKAITQTVVKPSQGGSSSNSAVNNKSFKKVAMLK